MSDTETTAAETTQPEATPFSSAPIGDKETKEALVAVNELAVILVKALKDGFQPVQDGMEIYEAIKTPEVMAKLQAAADQIGQVPAELKDLDITEDSELAIVQLSYLPKFVEALKK
jgi:hypothetical protein